MDLFTPATVRGIVKSLSGAELTACAQAVIEWQNKHTLAEGTLHALAARLVAEAGVDAMSSLEMAESAVLRKVAIRFITMTTGLRADE